MFNLRDVDLQLVMATNIFISDYKYFHYLTINLNEMHVHKCQRGYSSINIYYTLVILNN